MHMSNRQGRQLNTRERRDYYIEGNTVRKTSPARRDGAQLDRREHAARRNRDKARYMNFGYVLFLSIAVFITALTLLGYIKAQSELTISIKNVAALERELNILKLSNDEKLVRINASINMEEIKRIAVEDLGMTYAKEGQVIVIESEGNDYVRQLQSLN